MFQSPSLRGSGRFTYSSGLPAYARSCFNPLHCGAVVASGGGYLVIATGRMFQSPSLRGSGRFGRGATQSAELRGSFQSPSLRGSGRFIGALFALIKSLGLVSIPFIAGQWSLPFRSKTLGIPNSQKFQSPSLRGSGRFKLKLVSMTSFS